MVDRWKTNKMIFLYTFINCLMNRYVPDALIPILICFPAYETSCKFSKLFYENYKSLPQHKVLFDEYVIYTGSSDENSPNYNGYLLGSMQYEIKHIYPFLNESQEWRKNGVLHRDNDLPAYIWADGTQEWYKN